MRNGPLAVGVDADFDFSFYSWVIRGFIIVDKIHLHRRIIQLRRSRHTKTRTANPHCPIWNLKPTANRKQPPTNRQPQTTANRKQPPTNRQPQTTAREGVYREKRCALKPKNLNHAVLLVGWGTNGDGQDYWIVRNSWSKVGF